MSLLSTEAMSSLVWFSQSNEHGRSLAAPGSVARGQGLFDLLGKDVVFGNGEIGPGFKSKLAEFVHATFFHQLVAVGRGPGLNQSQANQASKRIPPVTRRMPSEGRSRLLRRAGVAARLVVADVKLD